MKRLLILAAILAAACQPLPVPGESGPIQTGPAAGDASQTGSTDCGARGGTMQPVGKAQTMQCVVAFADAGRQCRTGSDCQGDCRIEDAPFPATGASATGRCQANSQPFGCHARVENGKATPAICID